MSNSNRLGGGINVREVNVRLPNNLMMRLDDSFFSVRFVAKRYILQQKLS